jgi:hypothetical protein
VAEGCRYGGVLKCYTTRHKIGHNHRKGTHTWPIAGTTHLKSFQYFTEGSDIIKMLYTQRTNSVVVICSDLTSLKVKMPKQNN